MAINTPIQGPAADLIKMAMIRIHQTLKSSLLQSKLVLQIHDELLLIIPKAELEIVQELVKDCMENITPLKVTLKVNIETGTNWMEL
jgi:DNA polymerase-1